MKRVIWLLLGALVIGFFGYGLGRIDTTETPPVAETPAPEPEPNPYAKYVVAQPAPVVLQAQQPQPVDPQAIADAVIHAQRAEAAAKPVDTERRY